VPNNTCSAIEPKSLAAENGLSIKVLKPAIIGLALSLMLFVTAWGQAPLKVLIVDETEGLVESLAVNAIAGLLKQQTQLFATVDAVIAPVGSPFDLPFLENPTGKRYDLVIVAPKGVLELKEIWLATASYPQRRAELMAGIDFLQGLAQQFGVQFKLELALQDMSENLFVGILSGYFVRLGVL